MEKIEIFVTLFYNCVFLFAILNAPSLYKTFLHTRRKISFVYSALFVLPYMLCINPIAPKRTHLLEFSRVIGRGIIFDYDCSRVIKNFFIFFIVVGAVYFLSLILLNALIIRAACLVKKRFSYEAKEVVCFLRNFTFIAMMSICFEVLCFGKRIKNIPSLSVAFICFVFVAMAFYLLSKINVPRVRSGHRWAEIASVLEKREKNATPKHGKMPSFFSVAVFCWCFGFVSLGLKGHLDVKTFLLFGILSLVVILGIIYWGKISTRRISCSLSMATYVLLLCFSFIPVEISLLLESINIAKEHNILIGERGRLALLFIILLITCVIIRFLLKHHKTDFKSCANFAYPIIVAGISLLSAQLSYQTIVGADILESANCSILISDFFNFGKIPIVSHYGGHMMQGVLEGILYGLLNKDFVGAIYTPYLCISMNLTSSVLFYLLLAQFIDRNTSLVATLLFPFYNSVWNYHCLGIAICLFCIKYIRASNWRNAFFVWISAVFCCLYRLDIGFAYSAAVFVTLCIYCIHEKDKHSAKQLFASLAFVIVVCAATWTFLCAVKSINPISRLLEFIHISMSNQHWGYEGIGNGMHTIMHSRNKERLLPVLATLKTEFLVYIVLPLCVEFCLLYAIFSKKFKASVDKRQWVILLALALSYFFNFPRSLVRHNMLERVFFVMLWSSTIFLSLFWALELKKKMLFFVFSPLFIVFIMGGEQVYKNNFFGISLLDNCSVRMQFDTTAHLKKTKRVVLNDDMEQKLMPLKEIMNAVLKEDETFLDFCNASFAYSALGRECPVYVSQSPMQVSGEYAQRMFIEEIKSKKVPVALLPGTKTKFLSPYGKQLDGIDNNIRHYIISQYIYQKYVPLCMAEEFSIWCVPIRKSEMLDALSLLFDTGNTKIKAIDYGYDDKSINPFEVELDFHQYQLRYLPLLWAEKDKKHTTDNMDVAYSLSNFADTKQVQRSFSDMKSDGNIYSFQPLKQMEKQKGNYLCLEIDSNSTSSRDLMLGEYWQNRFSAKYTYNFKILRGKHKYIIRVSNDYYWYSCNINALIIGLGEDMKVLNVCISQGD